MRVSDVMVSNVLTAKQDDPIRSVAGVICVDKISGMPVVDQDNVVVGVISEKDILHALLPSLDSSRLGSLQNGDYEQMEERYSDVLSKSVGELMTKRVESLSPDCQIMEAASRMSLKTFPPHSRGWSRKQAGRYCQPGRYPQSHIQKRAGRRRLIKGIYPPIPLQTDHSVKSGDR